MTLAVRAGRQRRGSQAGTHGMQAARQEGRADEKASSGWQSAVLDAATCYAVSACRFRDAWELPRWGGASVKSADCAANKRTRTGRSAYVRRPRGAEACESQDEPSAREKLRLVGSSLRARAGPVAQLLATAANRRTQAQQWRAGSPAGSSCRGSVRCTADCGGFENR